MDGVSTRQELGTPISQEESVTALTEDTQLGLVGWWTVQVRALESGQAGEVCREKPTGVQGRWVG